MGSSTTTSQQKYPSFVEGFGKDFFKDAQRAFNKGPSYFKGNTTTPFSKQTTDAFAGMTNVAKANSSGSGMSDNLQQIMGNGGFNPGQLEVMSQMRGLADNAGLAELINGNGLTGAQNKAYDSLQSTVYGNNAQMQNVFNQGGLTSDQQAVMDFYRNGMNEQFGTDANYNRVKQNTLDAGAQGVNALAAKMGRFGGGANQNILSRNQMDTAAGMDVAELDKYRNRVNTAAGNRAGLAQTGLTNQQNISAAQQAGLGNIANMGAMGVDQRSNAINQKSDLESALFNMNQAGVGNMSSAYDTAMKPYQTQREVGQQYEDLYTRQMQDKLRRFDAKNPYNHLQQYAGLLSGAPMTQVQTSNPSWTNTLVGGLLAGSAFL